MWLQLTRVKSSSVAAVAFRWDVVAVDAGHQLVLRRSAVVHSGDGTYRYYVLSGAVHRVCDGLCCHCAVSVAGDYLVCIFCLCVRQATGMWYI